MDPPNDENSSSIDRAPLSGNDATTQLALAPRGKSSAMLHRMRSRDSTEESGDEERHRSADAVTSSSAAASNHGHTEDDPSLSRLLHRLRREHVTNFGAADILPDVSRARYLLEATAGNVGLASSLYWENFLTEAANHERAGEEVAETALDDSAIVAGEIQPNFIGRTYEKKISALGEDKMKSGCVAAVKSSNLGRHQLEFGSDAGCESDEKMGLLDRKLEQFDLNTNHRHYDDDEDADSSGLISRKPPLKKYKLTREKENNSLASISTLEGRESTSSRFSHALAAYGTTAPSIAELSSPNASASSIDAMESRADLSRYSLLHTPPKLKINTGKYSSNQRSHRNHYRASEIDDHLSNFTFQGITVRKKDDLNGVQGLSNTQDINSMRREMLPLAWRTHLEHKLGDSRVEAASSRVNRPQLPQQPPGGMSSTAAQMMMPTHPYTFGLPLPSHQGHEFPPGALELISRVFQGRQMSEEETHSLIAILGRNDTLEVAAGGSFERDHHGFPLMAREDVGDSFGRGNDDFTDMGSDEECVPRREEIEHRNSRFNNDEDPQNANFNGDEVDSHAATLRRSGRLRAQRDRSARGNQGLALDPHILNNNHDGGASISDDDSAAFVPYPVLVFREENQSHVVENNEPKSCKKQSSSFDMSASLTGKRKNRDQSGNRSNNLESEINDDDSELSDDSSVDVDEFFYAMDESISPSNILWGSCSAFSSNEDTNGRNQNESSSVVSIPLSWLRTGFTLSECQTGLLVAEPSDEEWDSMKRSLPQVVRDGRLKSAKGLFPYNCKGVSALLSIVTALLYSGASIRGSVVTCNADWTPFHEMTPEQRKKEFHLRLVEALSSLILIAAQAMSKRCTRALTAMDQKMARRRKKRGVTQAEERKFVIKRQKMLRRVGQCRVCWWQTVDGGTFFPQGRDPKDVQVHSSLTNIQDIRSYVRTNLRSFTEPGGCALFLETIIRCHGRKYFERLFSVKEDEKNNASRCLIRCHCKEALTFLEIQSMNKMSTETMPQDCINLELLSLLLTGESHSSYRWSADALGIGILRIDEDVGSRLMRPSKHVWICLGDVGYSTLILDKKNMIGFDISLDDPGQAFKLIHWNCWSGECTSMRVITSAYDQSVINSSVIEENENCSHSVVPAIGNKRQNELFDMQRAGCKSIAPGFSDSRPCTNEEFVIHPDDEKFYPGQYYRWRFIFGTGGSASENWIPFYRLCSHSRQTVERKLAPRICALIRNRWPIASVRDYSPSIPVV